MISWAEADRKLREASQLWALGRRLPHVQLPREKALCESLFGRLFTGMPTPFPSEEIVAELRDSWRRQKYANILDLARYLTPEQQRDLEICMYVTLARRMLQALG